MFLSDCLNCLFSKRVCIHLSSGAANNNLIIAVLVGTKHSLANVGDLIPWNFTPTAMPYQVHAKLWTVSKHLSNVHFLVIIWKLVMFILNRAYTNKMICTCLFVSWNLWDSFFPLLHKFEPGYKCHARQEFEFKCVAQ